MDERGWTSLFGDWLWVRGEGRFPIAAYSEFMPAPRIGQKPYGNWDIHAPFSASDPFGWRITGGEQSQELTPGLSTIARQVIESVAALSTGKGAHRIGRLHLEHNIYWPQSLARQASTLGHERYVFLSPLALSKTQDDKGRVRWTLFGASHEGPAKGFWQSFFVAPLKERDAEDSRDSIRHLLRTVYDDSGISDLRAAGLRILPTGPLADAPDLEDGMLPGWTGNLLFDSDERLGAVRYLLTFRPFDRLPDAVQRAYLAGQLHLLPCPASLVFWGSPLYRKLATELPLARQILLLQAVARHASPKGIRVPQSGWLHRPGRGTHDEGLGESRSHYRRTHRWQRSHREEDSTSVAREDHLHKVLFSAHPDDVGLYGKPMARNAQIWSQDFHAVLDGPGADAGAIRHAVAAMGEARSFGYRFYFPPMQAGRSTVFWHRPLIAFRDAAGLAKIVDTPLTGYFTATDGCGAPPVELWPRFESAALHGSHLTWIDASPSEAEAALGHPDSPDTAKHGPMSDAERSRRAEAAFAAQLQAPPGHAFHARDALTFRRTANRPFEVRYWKTIAKLAEGTYLNKNNADSSKDPATEARIPWPNRDLDQLGDFLLDYYRRLARAATTDVAVGELPFRWRTDFDFPWMEGWQRNQTGEARERDIAVVIPGRNRGEAIVMADHYDTAYMEDTYGYRSGKNDGARMSASGADDNHSATAALMLGAEFFMELSREGKLARDVWLVHLTGEEFPSDCLGARHLAETMVERTLRLEIAAGHSLDLSEVLIRGVYVLDMIAHNNERRRDVFQIAPGGDRQSLWLAYQAHAASRMWEDGVGRWNARGKRYGLGRGRRSPHGNAIPLMARHLAPRGEVRFQDDPRSTLFNTDGQIFADAGIPVVLFMENYDINREGYHDTLDTMANIDLDYGAAVAAIAIESVARAATEPLPQSG
ncbi:MAG: M28 family peptidase [Rhizomicrobium sp.]|jgi:hypothetical protein